MIGRLNELIGKIGPTIIVAAVVLGPGSILTSSRVGADFGFPGVVRFAAIDIFDDRNGDARQPVSG
jgi:hypothetical protein